MKSHPLRHADRVKYALQEGFNWEEEFQVRNKVQEASEAAI